MAYDPSKEQLDTKPWYKQFWPWFIIALPLASMLGSIATIYVVNSDVVTKQDIPVTSKDGFVKRGMYVSRGGEGIAFLDQSLKTESVDKGQADPLIQEGLEALDRNLKKAQKKDEELNHSHE